MQSQPQPEGVEKPQSRDYRVLRLLGYLETALVGTLTVSIVVVVLAQTISRYVFDRPLAWTLEVSQLLFIWLVYMGAALVSSESGHVTIRVLGRVLGTRGRKAFAVFAETGVFLVGVVLVLVGWDTTVERMRLPFPTTGWPAGLPLVGTLISFALMALHAGFNLWRIARGGFVDIEAEELNKIGI